MSESKEPHSRGELIAALDAVHREAAEVFASIPAEDFFRRSEPEVWSAGENAIHLIRSVKAVADAMKLPKLVLRLMFGTAAGSRRYAEVRQTYLAELAGGGVASGRYVPPSGVPEDPEASRSRALAGWRRTGDGLVAVVGKWREAALDTYRLPHPLLGKLSVREMLFFTHYHDGHHLGIVRRGSRPPAAG
jgi:DinB superfamily